MSDISKPYRSRRRPLGVALVAIFVAGWQGAALSAPEHPAGAGADTRLPRAVMDKREREALELETARLVGLTTLTTSPTFPLFLWADFTGPATALIGSDVSLPFVVASDRTLAPPLTGLPGEAVSVAFGLSLSPSFDEPALAGQSQSAPVAVYLAGDFAAPAVGQTGASESAAMALALGPLFQESSGGFASTLASDSFAVYLASGFREGVIGNVGLAVGLPFSLIPPGSGSVALTGASLSLPIVLFLSDPFSPPTVAQLGEGTSTGILLALQPPFLPPAEPQFVNANSGPFQAFLTSSFTRPRDGMLAAALGSPFQLALLALADGRTGFALSPPFELRLVDGPVPVLVSIVRAEYRDGAARVAWDLKGTPAEYDVERSLFSEGWIWLASRIPDGAGRLAVEDSDVRAGGRYGYRLKGGENAANGIGEVWLDIPLFILGLAGAVPNPTSIRRLNVAFTLPDHQPTALELLDVQGRLVASRDVGSLGPGRHVVDLSQDVRFAPGVYFIRLTRPGRQLVKKANIVD